MEFATYTCPVCGEEMTRDVELFINHTDGHIHEAMKREHPHWFDRNGNCEPCRPHLHGRRAV